MPVTTVSVATSTTGALFGAKRTASGRARAPPRGVFMAELGPDETPPAEEKKTKKKIRAKC